MSSTLTNKAPKAGKKTEFVSQKKDTKQCYKTRS